MSFIFGFDQSSQKLTFQEVLRSVELTPLEQDAVNAILSFFPTDQLSQIHLEKRSDSYTSMVHGERNDFLRFKLTDRTKWISVRLTPSDADANISNPLFAAQSNKNMAHWKAKISKVSDISQFKTFILNAAYNDF